MKLWIDDLRPAPYGWLWAMSTRDAIDFLDSYEIEVISLDHDAGDYQSLGGDYINVLNWIEEQVMVNNMTNVPCIHIHTANPVGAANMRRIIKKNHWKEVRNI